MAWANANNAGATDVLCAEVFCQHYTYELIRKVTVNVIKFQTLFLFLFSIKCWLSGLDFKKFLSE